MSNYTPDIENLVVGKETFKFERVENRFIENGTRLQFSTPNLGLEASMSGVKLQGFIEISTMYQLQQFAALISEAWKARDSLKLKLAKTESGH